MRPQVIKFKNGGAQTLRGGIVDLAKFGQVEMHRSSEIEFCIVAQKYYVRLMEPTLLHLNENLRITFFDSYELAIDHEVSIINQARKDGTL